MRTKGFDELCGPGSGGTCGGRGHLLRCKTEEAVDQDGGGSGTMGDVREDDQDGIERPAARTGGRPPTEDWEAMTRSQRDQW